MVLLLKEFEFELNDDNKSYMLKKVVLDTETVIVPDEYKGKPVTKIETFAFNELNTKKIIISKNIEELNNQPFYGLLKLEEFEVEKGNKNYSSKDGVLFNKDMTMIVAYPQNKEGDFYEISNDVHIIGESAFNQNNKLKRIHISENIKDIRIAAFGWINGIEEITFDKYFGLRFLEKGIFVDLKVELIKLPPLIRFIGCNNFNQTKKVVMPEFLDVIDCPEQIYGMTFFKQDKDYYGNWTEDLREPYFKGEWKYNAKDIPVITVPKKEFKI